MKKNNRVPFAAFLFIGLFFTLSGYAQTSAPSALSFETKIKEVQKTVKEGLLLDAQKQARALIKEVPSDSARLELARLLRDIRFQLLFSKKQTDTSERYEVQSGDTIGKVAKKYETTVGLIRKANKIKKDVIWAGMKLKVEKIPFAVEIVTTKNILWLKQGKHYVKKYQVSTGEKSNTPLGNFKIVNKVIDPAWYYENEVFLPGNPKNSLGSRWMGFDLKGYGIHGTIEPEKIGKPASLGCVRMRNEDVEELFDLIPVETPVTIRK